MTMKRSELMARIRTGLGDASNLDDSTVLGYLNWALTDIAAMFDWKEMIEVDESIKTAVGKDYYPLPDNIKDIRTVTYKDEATSRKLHLITSHKYREYFPAPEEFGTGFPTYYSIEGGHIRIYPLPTERGKTLEIFCVKWPKEFNLDEDDDCPFERLGQAIVSMAISIGARETGDYEKMGLHAGVAREQIKRIGRTQVLPFDYTPIYGSEPSQHREPLSFFHEYATTPGQTI